MNRFELLLITFLSASTAMAETAVLPKPPALTVETQPEAVLQTYPLGVITEQAAFAAHGGPDKKITLPNGKAGWVYVVGYAKNRETYRLPSGQTRTIDETAWELGVRNFTLVFDDGVVIDVIYKDDGEGIGVTAMELQYPRPQRPSGS